MDARPGGQLTALDPWQGASIHLIAYRITNDASLAEDVVQDAFLGAWRNAAKYVEGRGGVKTWLLSIVHHRAIDAIRRRRPTGELPDGCRDGPGRHGRPVAAAGGDRTGVLDGLTQQEIAERMGVPLGTVKSRMRLGLLAMRRFLVGEASCVSWASEAGPAPHGVAIPGIPPPEDCNASVARRRFVDSCPHGPRWEGRVARK